MMYILSKSLSEVSAYTKLRRPRSGDYTAHLKILQALQLLHNTTRIQLNWFKFTPCHIVIMSCHIMSCHVKSVNLELCVLLYFDALWHAQTAHIHWANVGRWSYGWFNVVRYEVISIVLDRFTCMLFRKVNHNPIQGSVFEILAY